LLWPFLETLSLPQNGHLTFVMLTAIYTAALLIVV
jgi:hypothetical protein